MPDVGDGLRCKGCNSPRWVSVSLDGGHTMLRQCVPCGKISDKVPDDKLKVSGGGADYCVVCLFEIKTMCFKGTGVCSDNCRKVRSGELIELPNESNTGGSSDNSSPSEDAGGKRRYHIR